MSDRRLLQSLERDRRWPGWKGQGARRHQGGMLLPCNMSAASDLYGLYKSERWGGMPVALNESAPGAVLDERRLVFAFGRDGTGKSVGVTWDWDHIIFCGKARSQLVTDNIAYAGMGIEQWEYHSPVYIFAYPIMSPWAVPVPNGAGWSVAWPGPVTQFLTNIAGGSTSGFINPATNLIDNYMAQCHACSLSMTPYNLTMVNDLSITFELNGASHDDGLTTTSPYSSFWNNIPAHINDPLSHGTKLFAMRVNTKPVGTVYGIVFYLCTLGDLQRFQLVNSLACWRLYTFLLDPNWLGALRQVSPTTIDAQAEIYMTPGVGLGPSSSIAPDVNYNADMIWGTEDADVPYPGTKVPPNNYWYNGLAGVGLVNTGKSLMLLDYAG